MKNALIILLISLGACAASTREKTIQTTFASLEAAENGFDAFSDQHQLDIATQAPDKATGEAQLAAFRKQRDAVKAKLAAAFHLLGAAVAVDNDQSVAAAVQAAAMVAQALHDLGVTIP